MSKYPVYKKEPGVHYGGVNIVGEDQPNGECGFWNTREDLEAACTENFSCIGYSMTTRKINSAAVEEDGFYPGCLKETKEKKENDSTQIYYSRIPERGNIKHMLYM